MFESLQPAAYGIATVFFSLGLVSIILRIYARVYIIKSFGWDDWFMVGVLFSTFIQQTLFYLFIIWGGGLHMQSGGAEHLDLILRVLIVQEPFYVYLHWIVKMSFLLFYLRLVRTLTFKKFVYASIAINTVMAIIPFTLYFVQCIPLNAFFNPADYPDAKCIPKSVLFYVPSSFSIFMDFVILLLPIYPLWNLHASLKRRLQLMTLVSFGSASVLVSMLRLIVLHQLATNPDLSYILGRMVIVSAIEIYLGIMAANVPALKAIWKKHVSKSFSKTDPTQQYSQELSKTLKMKIPSNPNSVTDLERRTNYRQNDQASRGCWDDNVSEEELVGVNSSITVTSTVAVHASKANATEDLNRPYYRF